MTFQFCFFKLFFGAGVYILRLLNFFLDLNGDTRNTVVVAISSVFMYALNLWNAFNGTFFIKVTVPHSSHMSNSTLINALSIMIPFYCST